MRSPNMNSSGARARTSKQDEETACDARAQTLLPSSVVARRPRWNAGVRMQERSMVFVWL